MKKHQPNIDTQYVYKDVYKDVHKDAYKDVYKDVDKDVGQNIDNQFEPFARKIQQARLPDLLLQTFLEHYRQLVTGDAGMIPNAVAQPIHDLPSMDQLESYTTTGPDSILCSEALARTAVIKLNGGLGTTMGLDGPKSLLVAKDGYTFLDIIVKQILHQRHKWDVRLPLILMNSFHTHNQTLAALTTQPTFEQDVPLWFEQHRVPKIWKDDLTPVEWPIEPQKEWCPPGHGNLYLAIQTCGLLEQLLAHGYEYAFISNADNLGAVVDPNILGYFAANNLTFLMEVTQRTESDRKGGHLAIDPNGHLILREVAQCPPEELPQFQDIERYRFFNTNNLWLHLPSLQQVLRERNGLLNLPLIRNVKPVDPLQPDSLKVYQLETAMGAAIGLLPNVEALVVQRTRFLPVKNTNHLLALRSDSYVFDDDFRVVQNP